MTEPALTPARILDAAEDVLRRYGPAKATVVDVARALGVSHGSVYRHFPSKAALRDGVTERWLGRVSAPLAEIAAGTDGAASARLRAWLEALIAAKRRKLLDDPEMFATYSALAKESGDAVHVHVEGLRDQIAAIVADGVSRGEFDAPDPRAAASAVLLATSSFHHPALAAGWLAPDRAAAFEGVWRLILSGLLKR